MGCFSWKRKDGTKGEAKIPKDRDKGRGEPIPGSEIKH